ncbi:MAG: MATE family efflux transporter [Chloroflexota bacterium]
MDTQLSPQTQQSSTNITLEVAKLAGPLVLLNLSQTLLGVADTFFVSRIGTDAVAAVGLASVIYFAVFMLFRGTANSTVVFVGRAHGEQDNSKLGTAVWQSINTIAWLSLITFILPFLFTQIINLAAPADNSNVGSLGIAYARIRSLEIPLIMFSGVVWGFLVGRGDSRTPMILAWITVGINIFLDWLLVLGNLGVPAMGVRGAATATVLANSINAILSAAILFSKANHQKFNSRQLRFSTWSEVKSVLSIGLPMGLGDFIEIASFSIFFALIARLGTEILAANQIALQFMSVSFTFGIAIAMAASSLVSKHLGAKEPELAEKVGYRAMYLAMGGMGAIGASYLIAPAALIGVFSQETAVIEAGVTILRLVALYQIFDGIGIVLSGALSGAGDTRFTMLSRIILAWGVFIPLVYLLIFRFNGGIWEAWAGALVYLIGLSIVYFLRFRSGVWKRIQI